GTRRGVRGFAAADRLAATHLMEAARAARVDRIIYLGGLGDDAPAPSRHLESRRGCGPGSSVPVRRRSPSSGRGVVIGAGGSSFEMMVQLVEHLPIMICPRWIDRRCQPIARSDLVEYLLGCHRQDATRGETYDVGGPEVLRYSEMLMRLGRSLGRPPCLVVLPRFTPGLSAHWVGYITDVTPNLARPIIDGMYVEAVCRDDRIRKIFPLPLEPFDRAASEALAARGREPNAHRLRGGHPVRPLEGRIFRLTGRAGGPGSVELPEVR
ncbi:NmrA family protein, partial [mine drainage metagenome]